MAGGEEEIELCVCVRHQRVRKKKTRAQRLGERASCLGQVRVASVRLLGPAHK